MQVQPIRKAHATSGDRPVLVSSQATRDSSQGDRDFLGAPRATAAVLCTGSKGDSRRRDREDDGCESIRPVLRPPVLCLKPNAFRSVFQVSGPVCSVLKLGTTRPHLTARPYRRVPGCLITNGVYRNHNRRRRSYKTRCARRFRRFQGCSAHGSETPCMPRVTTHDQNI